jgi:hypothetical protein
MTVALVLATATACDRAARPAITASPGDPAGAARRGARGTASAVGGSGASSGSEGSATVGTSSVGSSPANVGDGGAAVSASSNGAGTNGIGGSGAGGSAGEKAGTNAGGYADGSRSQGVTTQAGHAAATAQAGAVQAGAVQAGAVQAGAVQAAAALALPSLRGGQVAMQPLLARLCSQLGALGISDIVLITPPSRGDALAAMAWEGLSYAATGLAADGRVEVVECASVSAELRASAAAVRGVSGSGEAILVCTGDLVAHTEALAQLYRSPVTAALTDSRGAERADGGTRAARSMSAERAMSAAPDSNLQPALRLSGVEGASGRGWDDNGAVRRGVMAAGSAFHRVHAPNAVGCGAFLVSPADQDTLAVAADELATLAGNSEARPQAGAAGPGAVGRWPRGGAGFTDSAALLLVGIVRSGVPVAALDVGPLVCLRVQTPQQATAAAARLHGVNEDKVRLDAAVQPGDGPAATLLVNPYSRYLARWAARRRLSQEAVAGMSVGLGLVAAMWFSTGSRAGMIAGAAFLFAAFVLGCTDGQLARYARAQTAPGAWLAGFGGRVTEYAAYAGLAAGAAGVAGAAGPVTWLYRPGAWELAIGVLILQSFRDMIGFCVGAVTRPAEWPAGPAPLPLDEPADYAVPAQTVPAKASGQIGRGKARAGAGALGSAGTGSAGTGSAGTGRRPRAGWARAQARRLRRMGRSGIGWLAKLIEFGPGERATVICVTAVVAGARMTFIVVLTWGIVAAILTVIGQMVRSLTR